MIPLNFGHSIRGIANDASAQYLKCIAALNEKDRLIQIQKSWEAVFISEPVGFFSFMALVVILTDFLIGWNIYGNIVAFGCNNPNPPAWMVLTVGLSMNSLNVFVSSLLAKSYFSSMQNWVLFNKLEITYEGNYSTVSATADSKTALKDSKIVFFIVLFCLMTLTFALGFMRLSAKTAADQGSGAMALLSVSEQMQMLFLLVLTAACVFFAVYAEYCVKKIALNIRVNNAISAHAYYLKQYRESDLLIYSMFQEAKEKKIHIDLSLDLEESLLRVSFGENNYFKEKPLKSEQSTRQSNDLIS